MGTAIYARTCTAEKLHHTTAIKNQIAYCRDVAAAHNLHVTDALIFTDVEEPGDTWPHCWEWSHTEQTRPALSALIEAIEAGGVDSLLVHRLDVLGTSSQILGALTNLLIQKDIPIILNPEQIIPPDDDPAEKFALAMMRRCVQVDSLEERRRIAERRTQKLREIDRLQAKIHRLEQEIANLGKP